MINNYAHSIVRLVLTCISMIAAIGPLSAQTFPAGFSQVKVATIYYPTSMAVAPDGRIFVTEKGGRVKIIKNGAVLSTPFLQVNVDQLNERGLSGICLDPDFATNKYVYIYYTTQSSPIHNRLSRFTANGDVALAGSEVQIMNFDPCEGSIHNGGGMAFGPDGKLYLAVGNDNVNAYSQDLSNYKGKVLRINKDGSVPSGNPFTTPEAAKKIWAYGLRNPWSIAIQPGTGKIFVNEVGEGGWEEINDATVGGRNFGWPGSEGYTSNPSYKSPTYAYPHGSGNSSGCAITGGAFFNPAMTNYPSTYTGKYFYIDYCNNWINYLDLSSGTPVKHTFASNLGNALNYIKVGMDGNLYYFSISSNSLYKITYSNTNAPEITAHPQSQSVPAGQNVTFTVSASGATPLAYQWKKNGTNIAGATAASYTISNVNSTHAGNYTVSVSNSYGSDLSNVATLTVTGYNAKPTATISMPATGTIYRGGDVINFSGSGTDPENGALPASAHNWYVQFHHDAHVHPGPYVPPGVKTGSFSIAQTGELSANVFYRLFLYVTDAGGLSDTAYVDILPKKSTISLATQPTGLQIQLDGMPHATPYSVQAVSGMIRNLNVSSPQTMGGTTYTFSHWLHGGAASQSFTTTDNNVTFTAVFTAGGSSGTACSATGTITRDFWAGYTGSTVSGIPVNTTPTSTTTLNIFEGPSHVADYYGSRIRGYICPPVSGNYVFWISGDNAAELWLSTSANPSGKVKIASVPSYTNSREWTKYPEQQSAAIALTAGTKYYIEALHREGTQGDHLAVGWKLPNGTLERPIPGNRLSPFTSSGGGGAAPAVTITSPANGTTYSTPANITIKASATTSSGTITKVEFFQGTTKLGEDATAPYEYTWMNVTTGTYALKAVATNSGGQTGASSVVNVSVASCPTPIVTANGPTTMCSGSVVLKTTYESGSSYQWKKDGVNISGATGYTYTANSTGEYQVKVMRGSCIGWSAPTKVTIGGGLQATITAGGPTSFCPGQNVKLYANTCSGYTYQWKKNDVDIPGATAPTYTATATGNYQVRVTLSGNHAWSALVNVQVLTCSTSPPNDSTSNLSAENADEEDPGRSMETAIPQDSSSFQMKVFPNPTSGLFTIALNMPGIGQDKISIKIVNLLGQEVYTKEINSNNQEINEIVELDQSLATGFYTLQVAVGTKVENTTIVLSR